MILRNKRGLGDLGLKVNPAMYQSFNYAMVHGQGTEAPAVYDPSVGGYSINQHRFEQIFEEMNPGWYAEAALAKTDPAAAQAAGVARAEAWREKARALARGLPPCPAGSITDGGASCYYGRGGATLTTNDVHDPWGLIMPGTFVMYGVPFTPKDYKDGRITRVLKPDKLQRKMLEHAVIRASLIHLFGYPNRAMNPITRMLVGDGHIRDSMRAFLMKKGATSVSQDQLEQLGKTVSVDGMMEMVPDIRLFLVNFDRNPIQPDRWRTTAGGWMEWIRNGGYPLSYGVAHAQVSISEGAMNPEMCESILCQCPPSVIKTPWDGDGEATMAAGGQPSCVPVTLSKAAGVGEQGDWRPYVAIYQDMANPLWEFSLVYQDAAWYKKAAEFLAEWMTKLGKLYCGIVAPAAKAQLTKTQADVCTNAQGQACARGTPGCTCQAAPNASTASAANTNLYAQAAMQVHGGMCADWLKEYTTPPPMPDPQPMFPPPPPEPQGFKVTPLMIAIGVAGLGAAVLLTRKKPV
jgi:hypothetical protein